MNVDPKHSARPVFRAVDYGEAHQFSPWPARLMELDAWSRTERTPAEIIREYNEGWYRDLFELWQSFAGKLDARSANPTAVLRFFQRVFQRVADDTEKNRTIYRSSRQEYFFSAGDQLLVGDLILGTMLHYSVIVRYVGEQLARIPVRTVVEPGCGTGINLFHLFAYLDFERIVGGDICPNAVALGNSISEKLGIPGAFHPFDYFDPSALENLTRGISDYLLLTCHSIEQIQVTQTGFIDRILALASPPSLVVHCEPITFDDGTLMGGLCQRYANKNGYNGDLFEVLTRYQDEGRIEILDFRKRSFGLSAFNPTSLVSWRPRP